jgi:hypothetical protein
MTGDYISTSFSGGQATTVFPVGRDATTAAFDEAMYSPGRLSVASPTEATHAASSAGSFGAEGTGETHHALRNG